MRGSGFPFFSLYVCKYCGEKEEMKTGIFFFSSACLFKGIFSDIGRVLSLQKKQNFAVKQLRHGCCG